MEERERDGEERDERSFLISFLFSSEVAADSQHLVYHVALTRMSDFLIKTNDFTQM